MTQSWHNLLFAHWPVDRALVVSKIPASLELDLYDGAAWVGVVPFSMTNVAPRATPALPWISAFAELNVRTYVKVGDGKPGVFFFSLDAERALAVAAARLLFHLPYFLASMRVRVRNDVVEYTSRRMGSATPAEFAARYAPVGAVFNAVAGSLEHFLTERYCLYTTDRRGRALRVDIQHRPWPLQVATAELRVNTMAKAAGLELPSRPPLLHFARRQDVVAWLPVVATGS